MAGSGALIVTCLEPGRLEEPLGGKARALARLHAAGFPVPEWLAVLPNAFYRSLNDGQALALRNASEPEDAAAVAESAELAPEVQALIDAAVRRVFSPGCLLAVRSSAEEEDGARHSFAGQLDSFLFVPPDAVCADVVNVWRSAYNARGLAYRRRRGLPLVPAPPAVLVQRMVDPKASGVAFGADPVSGRRSVAVVSALWGAGSALVSGEHDADAFEVDRKGVIVGRRIADKTTAHRRSSGRPEGVEAAAVPPEEARRPALTDDQARRAADLARRAGRHFGRPQDIEWALQGEDLWLLQSRPITTLGRLPDPDGEMSLWDNSNIAESYSGVTTPLTFSFARRAYEEVYRQFCRVMGVPESLIAANGGVFRRMIGLVRGRIYYNLGSWYRVLSMLPGFAVNRKFMEQMMGVKEGIPNRVLADFDAPAGRLARLGDALRLAGTLVRSLRNYATLPGDIDAFRRRLRRVLDSPGTGPSEMTVDELSRHYRTLERELLAHWDAPLVNDFFTMIFFGLLRQTVRAWCGGQNGALHNDLLCGEGGLISAEPAKRLRAMAELARQDPAVVEALREGAPEEIRAALARCPELERLSRTYLEELGERCLEELKLETRTLHEDPLILWRSVGSLAARPSAPESDAKADIRRRAEERVRAALAGRPLRALVFRWILRQARRRIRDRENLRFERTRVFGRARLIFVELGRRLAAADVLEDPRDVFYLTQEEIFGFIEGTAVAVELQPLVALRRAEFDRYRAQPAPADRFETFGMVHQGNDFRPRRPPSDGGSGAVLRGLGCCAGVVRGPARVIEDPRGARLEPGEILVAARTDPGWVLLFPAAAGLLVEYGSLLSHSAIVARELGIPAVVSASGATRWVRSGEWLELDGSTGEVRKVPAPAAVGGAHGA